MSINAGLGVGPNRRRSMRISLSGCDLELARAKWGATPRLRVAHVDHKGREVTFKLCGRGNKLGLSTTPDGGVYGTWTWLIHDRMKWLEASRSQPIEELVWGDDYIRIKFKGGVTTTKATRPAAKPADPQPVPVPPTPLVPQRSGLYHEALVVTDYEIRPDKETPGCHRYQLVDAVTGGKGVTTLYLRKEALGGQPAPRRLRMTLADMTEHTK